MVKFTYMELNKGLWEVSFEETENSPAKSGSGSDGGLGWNDERMNRALSECTVPSE
jgi:hypothetical protein